MKVAKGKRLVYWGIGQVCSRYLKQYPNVRPEFFIDSNRTVDKFNNLSVKNPNEIRNWKELFVVITISASEEVEQILKSKMLVKDLDYIIYKDFFLTKKETLEESLIFIRNYFEENREYANANLIFAPVFLARNSNNMLHFYRKYGEMRRPSKCVLFSYLEFVKMKSAQNEIGYPVFDIPSICQWNGRADADESIDTSQLTHNELLSYSEQKWIRELEERKIHKNEELSYKITSEIYWYLKTLFSFIHPSKVIIWGGWDRLGYILADLAKRNNIPYGYMELGWIPGTFLFDKSGYAGQSVYAIEPETFLKLEAKNSNIPVKKIRKYIVDKKLDTNKFVIDENDEKKLQNINKQKRTVFVVGMDDYDIGINTNSEYWKKFVSSSVSSTAEAVSLIADICIKNDWNCIFKPHPRSPISLDNNYSDTIIDINFMEIDRLIQLSDVVVSIISKVDYKVLIYGKPLVQLGYTMLAGKGCSYEVYDIDVLEEQLKAAMEKGMTQKQNENFEKHMVQLLDNCLWDDMSERDLKYGLSLETDFFDK